MTAMTTAHGFRAFVRGAARQRGGMSVFSPYMSASVAANHAPLRPQAWCLGESVLQTLLEPGNSRNGYTLNGGPKGNCAAVVSCTHDRSGLGLWTISRTAGVFRHVYQRRSPHLLRPVRGMPPSERR